VPPARLVRAAGPRSLESQLGEQLVLGTRVEPEGARVAYEWTLDGGRLGRESEATLAYDAATPGRHRIAVTAFADGRKIGGDAWIVTVRAAKAGGDLAPEVGSAAASPPAEVASAPPEPSSPPPAAPQLVEDEVRRWLSDYARAWSRKDVAALRRMGQVRSPVQAEQLERYFRSIDNLSVDVEVLALHIEGERARVEFQRTDTLTDPTGKRRQLRLPPLRKEIERSPQGLRFSESDEHS